MKPSPIRVAVTYLVVIGTVCVLFALKLTIWSSPGIVVTPDGSALVVDSTFLGRYRLGLDHIRIVAVDGGDVIVDLRDPGGTLPNLFRLQPGENTLEASNGVSRPFSLSSGRTYAVTICGDNGWGRSGCRTKSVRMPTVQR